MVERLQLNLARYAICWNLDRLEAKIKKLEEVTIGISCDGTLLELYEEYHKYEKYLRNNL